MAPASLTMKFHNNQGIILKLSSLISASCLLTLFLSPHCGQDGLSKSQMWSCPSSLRTPIDLCSACLSNFSCSFDSMPATSQHLAQARSFHQAHHAIAFLGVRFSFSWDTVSPSSPPFCVDVPTLASVHNLLLSLTVVAELYWGLAIWQTCARFMTYISLNACINSLSSILSLFLFILKCMKLQLREIYTLAKVIEWNRNLNSGLQDSEALVPTTVILDITFPSIGLIVFLWAPITFCTPFSGIYHTMW